MKSQTCQHQSNTGDKCHLLAKESGFCYWHDDASLKEEENLPKNLEERAKTGTPMRCFMLQHAKLKSINLVNRGKSNGYIMHDADLYHADLRDSHLFQIDLSGSSLMKADLRGANLHNANLKNCNLLGIRLDSAKLEGIQWGDKILQEKLADDEVNPEKARRLYGEAEEIYRNIGREIKNQGIVEYISWFVYREMVVRRQQLKKYSIKRALSYLLDLYCGYGEKPSRLIFFSILLILNFALLYAFLGLAHNGTIVKIDPAADLGKNIRLFFDTLYFSVVTFTTLGYGDYSPVGVARIVASLQAFLGSFTIALFVVVFIRKLSR